MTPPSTPPAKGSEPQALPAELLDEQSRRAWAEPMAVKPFGDAYVVDCESDGTQFVRLTDGECSCDERDGTDRCKHLRRVAIEINLGRVPPPSERTVACRGCDAEVGVSVADDQPHLCADCRLAPGDLVVDREGDPNTPLLVVSGPGQPADEVPVPGGDCTVASYPGNDRYPADAPVVEAVFPGAVSVERPPRRYLFPVSRLVTPANVTESQGPRREALRPGWTPPSG